MAGVVDGQPVNQAVTNPAFLFKNGDDVTTYKLGLNRPADAPAVDSAQGAINKLYTATGASEAATGTAYGAPANTITNGDSHELALKKLADKFDEILGHNHDGTPGNGVLITGGGGGVTPVTFAIANNQVAPADVTGFLVNSATNTAFSAELSVRRQNTVVVAGGNDGTANATFQTNAGAAGIVGIVYDSAVQSDGSVILVGNFTSYAGNACNNICRISSLGVFDSTFNTNIGTGPSVAGVVYCVRLQADGKILVGGDFTTWDGNVRGRLARLNTTGVLDSGFLSAGNAGFDATVRTVNVLSDSTLVVGGDFANFQDETLATIGAPFALGLNASGNYNSPSPTFSPAGAGFNNLVNHVEVDGSDNLFFVGEFTQYNSLSNFKVAKTDASGARQTTHTSLGAVGTAAGIKCKLQSTGELVVVGDIYRTITDQTNVARFTSAGALDSAFNNSISAPGSGVAQCLQIQSDGKIIVGVTGNHYSNNGLFRLNSNGTADTTFNTAISPAFNASAAVYSVSLASGYAAYVGGSNMTTFDGSAISDNIILLGVLPSTTVTGYFWENTLKGVYDSVASDWVIGFGTGVGVATGVTFSITALGQLQYTSSNLPGTLTVNEVRFIILGL